MEFQPENLIGYSPLGNLPTSEKIFIQKYFFLLKKYFRMIFINKFLDLYPRYINKFRILLIKLRFSHNFGITEETQNHNSNLTS